MDVNGVDALGCHALGEPVIGGVLDTRIAEHKELSETISIVSRINIKYRNILSYLWSRMARTVANWTKTERNY